MYGEGPSVHWEQKKLRNRRVGSIVLKKIILAGISLYCTFWQEQLEFLEILPTRSHLGVQLWREPIHTDLNIWKLETFKNDWIPEPTPKTNKFWNQILEFFHKPHTTNLQQSTHIPKSTFNNSDATHAHSIAEFFKSKSTWVDSLPHIELSARAGPGFFCTNFFSHSDSLALEWYPNFNAAPGQAEKLLRIRKDLAGQTISEQIPCFPMTVVHIEEEVN
jgi:hypothetical protein